MCETTKPPVQPAAKPPANTLEYNSWPNMLPMPDILQLARCRTAVLKTGANRSSAAPSGFWLANVRALRSGVRKKMPNLGAEKRQSGCRVASEAGQLWPERTTKGTSNDEWCVRQLHLTRFCCFRAPLLWSELGSPLWHRAGSSGRTSSEAPAAVRQRLALHRLTLDSNWQLTAPLSNCS